MPVCHATLARVLSLAAREGLVEWFGVFPEDCSTNSLAAGLICGMWTFVLAQALLWPVASHATHILEATSNLNSTQQGPESRNSSGRATFTKTLTGGISHDRPTWRPPVTHHIPLLVTTFGSRVPAR